jgi:hypothetical protein
MVEWILQDMKRVYTNTMASWVQALQLYNKEWWQCDTKSVMYQSLRQPLTALSQFLQDHRQTLFCTSCQYDINELQQNRADLFIQGVSQLLCPDLWEPWLSCKQLIVSNWYHFFLFFF